MTSSLYLSRARLRTKRGEALASIAPLLVPDNKSARHAAQHHVIWLLFPDGPDIRQNSQWREDAHGFLWRDDGDGRYLILSRRKPADALGLFELDTKSFEPALAEGDRLRFALRVNPVLSRKPVAEAGPPAQGVRGKRVDVVMDALKPIAPTCKKTRTGRAFERDRIVAEATRKWFTRQGEKHGFAVRDEFDASGYTQIEVERKRRGKGGRPAGFSVVDLAGVIEITDPVAFLSKLPLGFGSAKAFGCGLMLIRRP